MQHILHEITQIPCDGTYININVSINLISNTEQDHKYLGTLRNSAGYIAGNVVVINKYYTLTSRSAIRDEWTKENQYGDATVVIADQQLRKNIVLIFRENEPNQNNNYVNVDKEFDLAVIKVSSFTNFGLEAGLGEGVFHKNLCSFLC